MKTLKNQTTGTQVSKTALRLRIARKACGVLAATALLTGVLGASQVKADPPSLHVSGNQLVDNNGNAVFLKGANLSGFESSENPGVDSSTPNGFSDYARALIGGNWNAKVVRLPISPDRWEGYNDPNNADPNNLSGPDYTRRDAYRQRIYDVVKIINDANAYVILDMHWSDASPAGIWGNNLDQHNMPDDNTLTAWRDIAHDSNLSYKSGVFFGLYNEPHDVTPDVWLNGGDVTESYHNGTVTYHTPGIQALINAVREQPDPNSYRASDNVLLVGGLDYAYHLDFVADGSFRPNDPGGRGIVYDVHIYPFSGQEDNKPSYMADDSNDQEGHWNSHAGIEAANAPLFIGEYGPADLGQTTDGAAQTARIQNWATSTDHGKYNGFCGMTAWEFTPYSVGMALIKDTTSFAPTDTEGATVQSFINNLSNGN